MPTEITTPPILTLRVQGDATRPTVEFNAMFDSRRQTYVNVSMKAEHPSIAITPTLLSKLRLGQLRNEALRKMLGEQNPELAKTAPVKNFFKGVIGRPVAEKIRQDPTVTHLDTVALLVRLARIAGDYPVVAVERSYGLERDDAKRWIALARKNGHLG